MTILKLGHNILRVVHATGGGGGDCGTGEEGGGRYGGWR